MGCTLFGPEKDAYRDIFRIICGERISTVNFNTYDRNACIIACVMSSIQKKNYGFWMKIYMTCVRTIFQNVKYQYPPNWESVRDKTLMRLNLAPGSVRYTCINDDRFETERTRRFWYDCKESESAIFLTETGQFFFVSYYQEGHYKLPGAFGKDSTITETEKVYYLKKDNLKANICMAYLLRPEDFIRILASFDVVIDNVPAWDRTWNMSGSINSGKRVTRINFPLA